MNVTATLGVELGPSATPDEVEAAMDLTSLSADDPIGLLSNDPDKFFGRTTKVCTCSSIEVGQRNTFWHEVKHKTNHCTDNVDHVHCVSNDASNLVHVDHEYSCAVASLPPVMSVNRSTFVAYLSSTRLLLRRPWTSQRSQTEHQRRCRRTGR